MDPKWEQVLAVDLRSVRERLMYRKGWWWRLRHDAGLLEKQYRQFLYLIVANPGRTVVPWSQDLDDFWHEHILDTAKYARDCDALLGSFIHHDPHLPKGTPQHESAYIDTVRLYMAAFKEKVGRTRPAGECGAGCGAEMPVVFCASHAAGSRSDGGHDKSRFDYDSPYAEPPDVQHDGGHGHSGHGHSGHEHSSHDGTSHGNSDSSHGGPGCGGHGGGDHGGGHGCGGHGGGHGCGGHGCGGHGHG